MVDELIIGNTFIETAYHEAGHIVVASATGLPLRPAGIIVYEVAENVADGYALYGEDESQMESVLMALLAGVRAQLREFPGSWIGGGHSDEVKFREIVKSNFENGWREMSEKLIPQIDCLLLEYWSAVRAIAETVLVGPWLSVQSSEHQKASRKKQVDGATIAAILERHGISARVCIK